MPSDFQKHHAEAIRDMLVTLTGSWSANGVVKVMSAMDLGIRRVDALSLVREMLGTGTRKQSFRSGELTLFDVSGTDAAAPNGASSLHGSEGKAAIAGHVALLLAVFGGTQLVPEDGNLPQWIVDLRTKFGTIDRNRLEELSPEERIVLGRVHALLFANYRVDEKSNAAAGARLASTIARMGSSPRFSDLTCRKYVRYGSRALELRDGKPFHSPFDIEAAFEYERK